MNLTSTSKGWHMVSIHAFFFLDLSITYPINIERKQMSVTPAKTGMRIAYSWGGKYLFTKWSVSTNGRMMTQKV